MVTSLDERYVRKSEEILGGFKCSIPKKGSWGKSMQHGVLIITTNRVIIWDRRFMTEDHVESFHYPDIRSAYHIPGIFTSHIIVDVGGSNKKFEDMPKNDTQIAVDIINSELTRYNNSLKPPIQPVQQTEDPFSILDRRLASGKISIEEYHKTKNAIQGKDTKSDDKICPSCGSVDTKQEKYCIECGFNLRK